MKNAERTKTLKARVSAQAERIKSLESRLSKLCDNQLETEKHISLLRPSAIVRRERLVSKRLSAVSESVARFERRLTLCTEVIFYVNSGDRAPEIKRELIRRALRIIDSPDETLIEEMCEKMNLDSIVNILGADIIQQSQAH